LTARCRISDSRGPDAVNLSVKDVRVHVQSSLSWNGNPKLKLGKAQETGPATIAADIVTTDNWLVENLAFDRHTGVSSFVVAAKSALFSCRPKKETAMRYELYYWPGIQGRGEFVRLALEDAGADYVDVARRAGGMAKMERLMDATKVARPSYAPPFLKAGKLVVGQTANILLYLGTRLGLAPKDEAGGLWTHQLQLTIADVVAEAHDTHHPIAGALYYEDQRKEAVKRAAHFTAERIPAYLGYFESVLAANGKARHLVGVRASYADLSLFQLTEGLRYAFPNAMAKAERKLPLTVALHDRVKERPGIARYLASSRRLALNESGIFRHYAELDR
jgi:glutathione S-transferase